MYTGKIMPPPFSDESGFSHAEERKAIMRSFEEKTNRLPLSSERENKIPETAILAGMLMFLLSDKTKTDIFLTAIIIYLLL